MYRFNVIFTRNKNKHLMKHVTKNSKSLVMVEFFCVDCDKCRRSSGCVPSHGGLCYKHVKRTQSWYQAREVCKGQMFQAHQINILNGSVSSVDIWTDIRKEIWYSGSKPVHICQ